MKPLGRAPNLVCRHCHRFAASSETLVTEMINMLNETVNRLT
jgi:hypothetical protein